MIILIRCGNESANSVQNSKFKVVLVNKKIKEYTDNSKSFI